MWQFVGTLVLRATGNVLDVYQYTGAPFTKDEADAALRKVRYELAQADIGLLDATYRLVPVGGPPPGTPRP